MRHVLLFAGAVLLVLPVLAGCGTTGTVAASEAAEAWYNLGNAYTELGRNDDAVKAYARARQLDPELMSAGYNLARVYIIQKKYDESLRQLDDLLERDPGNRMVRETEAWVYHLQGYDEAALEIYRSILDEFEDSRNSLYNAAVILEADGENSEALRLFRHLYDLYPDEKSAVFEIARLEAEEGNTDEAVVWVEKRLSEFPAEIQSVELYGDLLARQKKYADAVAEYRKIIDASGKTEKKENEPSEAVPPEVLGRVYLKTAEIMLINIEDTEEGLEYLRLGAETGAADQGIAERLLSDTEAEWYQQASSILNIKDDSAGTEGPAPADK